MAKAIDMQALRSAIANAPAAGCAATVTRGFLETVERELTELADRRARDAQA